MLVLGPARLYPEKQLLVVGARSVALQRKPYLVLRYLIEHRDRMVLRKELLDQFWEGQEVYDESLSKAVGSIRKAFGESSDGLVFIETRWGIGYQYVGPFGESPAAVPGTETVAVGDEPAGPANPAVQVKGRWHSWLPRIAVVSLIVGLTAGALVLGRSPAPQTKLPVVPAPLDSVAVLPFTAGSGSEEGQYLGLELSQAVTARLDTVPQLRVRSSNTVRSILGLHPDLESASKKLETQALVTGDVHRAGENFVINVHVLDALGRQDRWSGTFTASENNVAATADSIAQQVSSALLPQLAMNVARTSPDAGVSNPQVYAKYMKAKFFANMRTQNSLAKAIQLLQEVLAAEPRYARAYAALADCYQLQGFYQFVPSSQAYPRAEAAAQQALAMDNSLVEAHVSLLSALTDYDWDWAGAEREFRAAIAIDPNSAVAYQYYGYALLASGRGDEGVMAMKRGAELDPVSPSVQTSLAWGYYLMRQDGAAVDQCKRVLELYPDFVPAHQLLGLAYSQIGARQRAATELNLAETLERDSLITPLLLDLELARSGNKAKAAQDLEKLIAAHGTALPDYNLAAAWATIGDQAKAHAALQHAYRVRSNWVVYLQYDPEFDSLRADPRFQSLMHQVATFHLRSAPGASEAVLVSSRLGPG